MEADSDLLGVVAQFATTRVALDVLVHFVPTKGYDWSGSVWRQKAIIESRGLMVDESIIEGRWYEYYLIRNRTYCGAILSIQLNKDGGTKRELDSTCIVSKNNYIFATTDTNGWYHGVTKYYGLQQRDDFSVMMNTGKSSDSTQVYWKIRLACGVAVEFTDILFIVDEYGRLWHNFGGSYNQIAIPEYVVAVSALARSRLQILTRDGKLSVMHVGVDYTITYTLVDVNMGDNTIVYLWRDNSAVGLSNGCTGYYNAYANSLIIQCGDNNKYLSDTIESDLVYWRYPKQAKIFVQSIAPKAQSLPLIGPYTIHTKHDP